MLFENCLYLQSADECAVDLLRYFSKARLKQTNIYCYCINIMNTETHNDWKQILVLEHTLWFLNIFVQKSVCKIQYLNQRFVSPISIMCLFKAIDPTTQCNIREVGSDTRKLFLKTVKK